MTHSFLASQDFLKVYQGRRREPVLIAALHECINRLQTDPSHPGLNREKIDVARGVEAFSCRISQQYRLIYSPLADARVVLLYFDNHDEAYDWTKRSRDRFRRMVEYARTWRVDASGIVPGLPMLEEDTPVPFESLDALTRMLEDGMLAYIAHLDQHQRSYAISDFTRRAGSMFIRGGAGTGKTAIAIHRVAHLAAQQELDRRSVLYLGFNRVLVRTVTQALEALSAGKLPPGVEVRTFHEWADRYLQRRNAKPEITQDPSFLNGDVKKVIDAEGLASDLGGLGVTDVVHEIRNIIKPSGVATREQYLQLERHGAGSPLRQPQREAVWHIYEAVRYTAGGRVYVEDLPAIAVSHLLHDDTYPGYRAVIVDEAQDCSRAMAQMAIALVKGDLRRLTVLADPTQSIYPSGFYWARQEIAPRGSQNVVLRSPYRSTQEIHALARSLYDSVEEAERDVIDLAPSDRNGPKPVVRIEQDEAGSREALVETVQVELADQTIPRKPQEIGILTYSNNERDSVCNLLESHGIASEVVDAGNVRLNHPAVKVLTVHSAKGLDFPSVYLYRFTGHRTDPAERRALLYVALTRSAFRLTLLCDKDTICPVLEELNPDAYQLTGPAKGLLAR